MPKLVFNSKALRFVSQVFFSAKALRLLTRKAAGGVEELLALKRASALCKVAKNLYCERYLCYIDCTGVPPW